jgi:hypothetical protein
MEGTTAQPQLAHDTQTKVMLAVARVVPVTTARTQVVRIAISGKIEMKATPRAYQALMRALASCSTSGGDAVDGLEGQA